MNPKDILDLTKDKVLIKKEGFILFLFSFIYTYLTFVLFYWIMTNIDISNSIFYKTILNSERVFLIIFVLLIFLFWYYIGSLFSKIYIITPTFGKTLFQLEGGDVNFDNLLKHFDFQGILKDNYRNKKCLYLNDSSEGLVTKKRFRNFLLNFKAKLFYHGFGLILCARDLENYFMLRINFDKKKGLYITPHVRKNGIWEIQKIEDEKENGIQNINEGDVLEFQVFKQNRTIRANILKNKETLKSFDYLLPDFFPLLPISENNGVPSNVVLKLDFPNFGKIGFRAWGANEKAIIEYIKIEKA